MRNTFFTILILFPFWIYGQSENAIKDTLNKDTVLLFPEEMPQFDGGAKVLWKFIYENIKYSTEAEGKKVKGTVCIKFIVDKDGSLKDFRVLNKNKLGYGYEESAIDVIKKMPNWNPGRQNGKAVAAYYTILFRFPLKR